MLVLNNYDVSEVNIRFMEIYEKKSGRKDRYKIKVKPVVKLITISSPLLYQLIST